jgi:3-oxoacyl-[acyl-carrier-protein] synthase-3
MVGQEVHIRSVGTALPGSPVDNAALTKAFRLTPVFEQWIDAFVGTRTRYLALDLVTGEQRYSLADLGETAARRALETAGVAAGEVDLVVMGTSMPDALLPTTVNVIAERAGITGVPGYQLQSGCSGAMQALDLAHQFLLAGRHRTALVLGGDVCAKHIDLSLDYSGLPPEEMVNMVLFGDGAGAAVLTREPGPGSVLLHRAFVELSGLAQPPGQRLEWYGLGDRDSGTPAVREDFKAIADLVPELSVDILARLLKEQDWQPADLDFLLPPQLSVRMTEKIMARLDVPGVREVSCVAETGNTGNALPFFQLERALPEMAPGDRAVAVAVESSRWIKAGLVLEKA